MSEASEEIYFISGDIFNHSTGGTLCDRMVTQELERKHSVRFIIPQIKTLWKYERPLVTGLINNARNLFRYFPRGSLLFIDHGVYRDCFIAANFWKWLYGCQVVGLVYHLDYELPQMKGGKALRVAIEKMMVRVYDFALTISRSTANHLEYLGQSKYRIDLIPVSRRFEPQPIRSRPITDKVTFLFVGSIEPRKGLLDAIEALSGYSGSRRIVFNCVGNCDLENAYSRELISATEKCSHLTFNLPGAVSQQDLVRFFEEADAFLFPSHWEGYGIAIEEAMCFALPVIAYDAGAVPELVENGVTGWLAPLRDIDSLARSVAQCIDDPKERQRRGARGLEKAKQATEKQSLAPILERAISKARA